MNKPLTDGIVLSPHEESILMDIEDAILLGNEARAQQVERVEREFETEEINHRARRMFMALLQSI